MIQTYISILFCIGAWSLHGQPRMPDSVEAIVIHFKVLPPLDRHGLPKSNVMTMRDFYYILWDKYVIIKELDPAWPNHYRLFHLDKRILWWCTSIEGVIHRDYPEPHEVLSEEVLIPEVPKETVLDLPVRKYQVLLRGGKDTLVAWQTDEFGVNFSTIADLPGIPLYYERIWEGHKMRFVAQSIDSQMLDSDFFNVLAMPVRTSGYVEEDILRFDENSLISKKGVHLPDLRGKSLQGDRIRLPDGKPVLVCFLRAGDARSGYAEIATGVLRNCTSAISCVVVFDFAVSPSRDDIQTLTKICPVLDNNIYTFQEIGIPSSAFFVVVDSGGYIDEIVIPFIDGWEETLAASVAKVLRK